jgi:hypothetical protein
LGSPAGPAARGRVFLCYLCVTTARRRGLSRSESMRGPPCPTRAWFPAVQGAAGGVEREDVAEMPRATFRHRVSSSRGRPTRPNGRSGMTSARHRTLRPWCSSLKTRSSLLDACNTLSIGRMLLKGKFKHRETQNALLPHLLLLRSRSGSSSFTALALNKPSSSSSSSSSSSWGQERSTAGLVSYTGVARSRSGSSSFTASPLNKPSSSSSSSSSSPSFIPPYLSLLGVLLVHCASFEKTFLLLLLLLLLVARSVSVVVARRERSCYWGPRHVSVVAVRASSRVTLPKTKNKHTSLNQY